MSAPFIDGRPKRTKDQRIREMLKRETTKSTEKFGIGGREKENSRKPKPITLPKIGGEPC